MVNDQTPDDRGDGPARICATCGHSEVDHVDRDAEVPGATLRRTFCETCDDSHDFLPDPLDV